MTKTLHSLFPATAVILLLTASSCTENTKSEADPRAGAPLQAEAIVVVPQHFASHILTTANLLPYEEVELKAPLAGTVLSIDFREGQEVAKGQSLIRLDDRMWKAQVKGLEARLKTTRNELGRKEELLGIGGASQEQVEQARAAVNELEAHIEELYVNIGLANITAPFSGKVGMRNFSVGSYLPQGQAIIQLVQLQKLKVDFNISGRYLPYMKEGQKVQVISSADTAEATVYAVHPMANASSRTIPVRAVIHNNTKEFIPGNFAEVIISISASDQALIVPTQVIIPELNAHTLYVVRNGKAHRVEVVLGTRTDTHVEVIAGINPGDTVLTTGLLQVRDQAPVQITGIVEQDAL